MKSTYDVLWFEDQSESVQGAIDSLIEFCRQKGVKFTVRFEEVDGIINIDELADRLDVYNPYDLIVYDYDLGSELTGTGIAGILRQRLYTEMICYSSKDSSSLMKYLSENDTSGVFVASRDDLVDELEGIVGDSIKRLGSINSFRGYVLSEMSELDSRFRKVLKDKIASSDAGKVEGLKKYYVRDLIKGKKKDISRLEGVGGLEGLVDDHRIVDFNTCKRMLAKFWEEGTEEHSILHGDEVLNKLQGERNKLAHQSAVYTNGRMMLESGAEYDLSVFEERRVELMGLKKRLKFLGGDDES